MLTSKRGSAKGFSPLDPRYRALWKPAASSVYVDSFTMDEFMEVALQEEMSATPRKHTRLTACLYRQLYVNGRAA